MFDVRPARSARSAAALGALLLVAGLLAACGGTGTAHVPGACPGGPALVKQIRERSRVDSTGAIVTMDAPTRLCAMLRVYTVQYLLDAADRAWQQPTFVDTLRPGGTVTAQLPAAVGTCTAAAVIAVPDAVDLDTAAGSTVQDFEGWPTAQQTVVPTGDDLDDDGTYVVAALVRGRPSSCRSGQPVPGASDPATATPDPAASTPAVVADPAACEYQAVGAALRPTVKVSGSTVTVSPGALACTDGVAIYVADYTLTKDPADEVKATQAGTVFPGSDAVTLTFPSSFAQCRASAVYFETVSADADQARLSIRQELARWQASSRAVAPDATYVARYPRTRLLLARNISGLDACQPKGSQKVSVPTASVKDCWGAGPGSQPGRPEYVEIACSAEHVYEVFYVKNVSFADYLKSKSTAGADAWVEKYAQQTCRNKQSAINLTGNYRASTLATTYIYPSPLDPLATTTAQQVVCLVHRSDLHPVSKRIMR